jgi:RHS repeat-associated protein
VYIFSGNKVIAEYDNGAAVSSPSREYLYNSGQLMATINSSGMQYHIPDHLSVRVTTNSSGSEIGQQGHFPYGESWYASSTTTNWQFTTYERDAESSNDYAQARYNVNRLGRFSSPDPIAGNIGDPQSLNRYSYVRNEPIDFMDPMGMDPCYDYAIRKEHSLDHGEKGSGPSADGMDAAPQGDGCNTGGASTAGGGAPDIIIQSNPAGPDPPDPYDPGLASQPGCKDTYSDGAYVGNTCDGSGTNPSKSGSGSGGGAIAALNQAANWLSNAKLNKKNCLRDLGMLGVTPDRAQAGAANANIQNGVGSTIPLSSLYTSSPVPSVAQAGGSVSGTVGDKLAQPGVVAVAQLGGANIYVNVGMIQGGNSWNNRGLVLHEVLHNITGYTDPDIQLRLGLPQVAATNNITQKLITDCF